MGIKYNLLQFVVDNENIFTPLSTNGRRKYFFLVNITSLTWIVLWWSGNSVIFREFNYAPLTCVPRRRPTNPQDVNLPFSRDPDPSCECSARCLPSWKANDKEVRQHSKTHSAFTPASHVLFGTSVCRGSYYITGDEWGKKKR